MTTKNWRLLAFCFAFTVIGIIGGWIAARQGGALGHSDEKQTQAAPGSEPLPAETLENLGVRIENAKVTTFVAHRSIPAVVSRTPFNEQPVVAPLGGRVLAVSVEPGMVVQAGDTLLTLVREPIPRPELKLTEEILKPARESVHQAVVDLRKNREEAKIIETELERIAKYTEKVAGEELPVLPRQTAIELRYRLLRAQSALERARLELEKHGFTKPQVDAMQAGGAIPDVGEDTWRRALQRNGLWTEAAQSLYEVVPENLRPERWTIATIGELAAGGLVKEELVSWLKEVQESCEHFLEIGSLLQQGYSVEDIQSLHDLGALDPIVRVKAPGTGRVDDWDVVHINAKPGDKVLAGALLVTLLDPREMYLKTEPVGAEKKTILDAVGKASACEARPLVEGAGPTLRDLTIGFVSSEEQAQGTVAYVKVRNEVLAEAPQEGRKLRSWKLRSGLKYVLKVPVSRLENAFVVPSDAIAEDGPHKVVFIQDGDSFKQIRVAIAYQDQDVAVLLAEKNKRLFPDDPLVVSGAYGLSLALKGGSAKPDAHAGHQH